MVVAMRLRHLLAATVASLAAVPAAEAATDTSTSANWAGYAVHGSGVKFRRVSATWTVPSIDCSTGGDSWSAHWVGLGGFSESAPALEQVGTDADCTASGRATYSAWYELVPAASHAAR